MRLYMSKHHTSDVLFEKKKKTKHLHSDIISLE